ncbi:hypothetical protein [Cellulosilyticum sp. I15G10I2]|uniref:hypothetical protein n=1 Tax=Cellulosilyticum sp. I15G10I2 TaxID=1892843 RepID=UPI00085C47D7|nr:hypothetical protein [Cellulosilyticum sp. I15G10I2]
MQHIEYNILKRAKHEAREADKIYNFLQSRSINIQDFKANPDRYSDIIKEYSRECITKSLYEESKERLEREFNRLCEYHTQNEAELTNAFYNTAKQIIVSSEIDSEHV